MYGNAYPHTVLTATNWWGNEGSFLRSAQFPNMNPFEHVWDMLTRRIASHTGNFHNKYVSIPGTFDIRVRTFTSREH